MSEHSPGIVLALVDDTGWGDVGVYDGRTPTPNIHRPAKQGICFDNDTVEAQCTPTRSASATGTWAEPCG